MSKEYLIDEDTLIGLIKAKEELTALECGGVDNWYYYCDSLNEYLKVCRAEDHDDYEDYDELAESIIEKEYDRWHEDESSKI